MSSESKKSSVEEMLAENNILLKKVISTIWTVFYLYFAWCCAWQTLLAIIASIARDYARN